MKVPWVRDKLGSRLLSERVAALEARRTELAEKRAADRARLAAELDRVDRDHAVALAAAERVGPETEAAIDAEHARKIRARLYDVVAGFVEAPRSVSIEIAAVWGEHVVTVRDELGAEPSKRVIIAAFLNLAGGADAVALMGSPDFVLGSRGRSAAAAAHFLAGRIGEAQALAGENWTGALGPVGAAERERLFRSLEADAARALGAGFSPDAERAEVLLSFVTENRIQAALAALDARRASDQTAAAISARAAYEKGPEHRRYLDQQRQNAIDAAEADRRTPGAVLRLPL